MRIYTGKITVDPGREAVKIVVIGEGSCWENYYNTVERSCSGKTTISPMIYEGNKICLLQWA